MESSQREIDVCLGRLSEEQILYRGAPHENSIANLLLHLTGNLRQWILHGIDGQPDGRMRDEEFVQTITTPVDEICQRFRATLAECRAVVSKLPEERLLVEINPQPSSVLEPLPILSVVFHVVGHLQLHTGQIILLTKQLGGRDLDLWIPRKR